MPCSSGSTPGTPSGLPTCPITSQRHVIPINPLHPSHCPPLRWQRPPFHPPTPRGLRLIIQGCPSSPVERWHGGGSSTPAAAPTAAPAEAVDSISGPCAVAGGGFCGASRGGWRPCEGIPVAGGCSATVSRDGSAGHCQRRLRVAAPSSGRRSAAVRGPLVPSAASGRGFRRRVPWRPHRRFRRRRRLGRGLRTRPPVVA